MQGRGVSGSQPMSTAVHRSQINFRDLTPYLTICASVFNIFSNVSCLHGVKSADREWESGSYAFISMWNCGSLSRPLTDSRIS
jgi:hypothetical protein